MSLKAVKELIAIAHQAQAHEVADAAHAQTAALEKAADTLGVCGWLTGIEKDVNATEAEREAVAVLKAIAKEAM